MQGSVTFVESLDTFKRIASRRKIKTGGMQKQSMLLLSDPMKPWEFGFPIRCREFTL